MRIAPLLRFFHINKDVFLRTACIVAAYTFFTSASSRFGDTILATNTLLMNLFTLFSYMSDGMAYAAESLSGRFVGERNPQALKKCIRLLILWSGGIAALYVGVYVAAWRPILSLFGPSAGGLHLGLDGKELPSTVVPEQTVEPLFMTPPAVTFKDYMEAPARSDSPLFMEYGLFWRSI